MKIVKVNSDNTGVARLSEIGSSFEGEDVFERNGSPTTRLSPKTVLATLLIGPMVGTCSLVIVAYIINGRSVAEKVATFSLQPLFITILFLITIGGILVRERRYWLGGLAVLIGGGLWALTSDVGGGSLVRSWEQQLTVPDWDDLEPMDYVIVLGGGTGKRPDGAPQLMGAGDRVVTAARLYHRGLVKNLITTGDVLVVNAPLGDNVKDEDRPTMQTRTLWRELGIPDEIVLSVGGQNTSSEMRELAAHPEWWKGKRCGLVTSASHMPRAVGLAAKHGIEVIPIPCNFWRKIPNATAEQLMPNPEILYHISSCFKEWLGKNIGR